MSEIITPEKKDQHGLFQRRDYLIRVALAVVLLLLSIGFFIGGIDAIRQQQYEIKWRATRAVGFLTWQSHGVSQYQGAAAVRMGVGLVSVGVMFTLCAVVLFWSPDLRRAVSSIGQITLLLFGWLSFCALLLACGCFFPPWQVESISFYGVVILLTAVVALLRPPIRERWGGRMGIALIVGMLVAGFFRDELFVGMALGLFVFFIGGAHLALLASPIRRAVEQSQAPSGS